MQLRLGDQAVSPLGRLRLYVCGITPYDTTHLGHSFTFVWVDTLARVLEHVGVEVEVCRNVTDVDDDLLDAARRRGVAWQVLANQQTYQFEDDMRHLRVRRPSYEPWSHDYVSHVVFLARALVDRGAAYERGGTVYFRGADALARSGLDRDEALVLHADGHGHPEDPAKDDPLDVAVWQPSAPDEPAWPSPWGPGRPGWHAECAAMAMTLLGLSVDVHAGGADLAFPHHAYESAMAEAASGVAPFARSWMHIGTVHTQGEKMAKSTGNLVLVGDLLRTWSPEAVRFCLVDRPWWQAWEFDGATLDVAAARLEELWTAAARPHTDEVAEREVVRLMVEGQDVAAAFATASEAGGSPARTLALVLGVR